MSEFYMNGQLWQVAFIEPYSSELVDRTGQNRVATTDPLTHQIYLSATLQGEFLRRVLLHELGHAAMISYNLLNDLHRMVVPKYWIEMEEWVCNFIADYGLMIFRIAYKTLGDGAWDLVPREIDKIFSKGE